MKNIKIESPDTHLVTAYTVSDSVQAEMIRNMLADHGIEVELGGEQQGGFTGTFAVEIIVRECDYVKALEFIRMHFPNA